MRPSDIAKDISISCQPCLFSGSVNSSDVCQVYFSVFFFCAARIVVKGNLGYPYLLSELRSGLHKPFQGRLGDCWFLSAVAVLTEMSRISEVIITPEYNDEGIYTVRFCIQVPNIPMFKPFD
jgi:hypothetical protein